MRDQQLTQVVREVHARNYSVYGYRKMWHAMTAQGWDVGRDQVARLMRAAGLAGVVRGRRPTTTRPARQPDGRADLVGRRFQADAPNRLSVADFTYVRIRSAFAYTAFITDVCTRKIVGWAVSTSMSTDALPLAALEHALVTTGAHRGERGLIHHSDRGSQYVPVAYSDALVAAGVRASVGTVGDSYDNALAETVNGLYKAELIHSKRVWESAKAGQMAPLDWVHWWNTRRIHQSLAYHTPQQAEHDYHRQHTAIPAA